MPDIEAVQASAPQVVKLLEARIAHSQILEDRGHDTDYEAIPSSYSWSTLAEIRRSPEYEIALRHFRDLIKRYPAHALHLMPIFWHMGTTDTTTFLVIDELLHTTDPDDPARVIDLLIGAPRGLAVNCPMFALHVLTECATRSEELERAAIRRLISNCFSSGFIQMVPTGGRVPIQFEQDAAAKLLALCEPGSLAFRLYTAIANAKQPAISLSDIYDDSDDFNEL